MNYDELEFENTQLMCSNISLKLDGNFIMLDKMLSMYDYATKYGIDESFVRIHNTHYELDGIAGMIYPCNESFSEFDVDLVKYKEACMEGLLEGITKILKWILDRIKALCDWIGEMWDKFWGLFRTTNETNEKKIAELKKKIEELEKSGKGNAQAAAKPEPEPAAANPEPAAAKPEPAAAKPEPVQPAAAKQEPEAKQKAGGIEITMPTRLGALKFKEILKQVQADISLTTARGFFAKATGALTGKSANPAQVKQATDRIADRKVILEFLKTYHAPKGNDKGNKKFKQSLTLPKGQQLITTGSKVLDLANANTADYKLLASAIAQAIKEGQNNFKQIEADSKKVIGILEKKGADKNKDTIANIKASLSTYKESLNVLTQLEKAILGDVKLTGKALSNLGEALSTADRAHEWATGEIVDTNIKTQTLKNAKKNP